MIRTKLHLVLTLAFFAALSTIVLFGSQPVRAKEIAPVQELNGAVTDCNTITEISKVECEALVAVYDATGGSTWTNQTNWKVNNTPCDSTNGWYGVTCSGDAPKHITQLVLDQNNLIGTIPTEIGNLTYVIYLNLATNSLTGSIPTTTGNMTALMYLYLGYNDLTGGIPTEVSNLSNLLTLNFVGNQLSGSIPKEIGSMTGLLQLELAWNELGSEIPVELGGMASLRNMVLIGNNLEGSIPTSLGGLSNLEWLMLYDNQLNGNIPPAIGSLSNLTTLYLQNNQFSGSIPPELGSLPNLEQLYLNNNILTGSIPEQIGSLANLNYLILNDNQLSGSIPTGLGSLVKLNTMNLSNNQLSGSIPISFGSLTSLQGLYLDRNNLTGNIPTEIGNIYGLDELTVNDNDLSGSLPLALTSLSELSAFHYAATALCAPNDTSFVTWLTAIPNKTITWNCLAAPTKTSPVNYAFTNDTTPKFTWQKQMEGEKYQILVDNDSDFASPVLQATGLVNPYKTFTTTLAQGAFYWKVRAKDPGGNWSPWSTKWKFTVDTTAPGKPILVSPVNESKTTDRTPTFTWKAVSGAKYYQLIVDDNADFSSPVYTSPWGTTVSKTLGTPLTPKLYYWKVRAKDAAGNIGAWSGAWKLTIK